MSLKRRQPLRRSPMPRRARSLRRRLPKDYPVWRKARAAQIEREPYCAVCGKPGVVHHYGRDHGMGRRDHKRLATLCNDHHTGDNGVHPLGRETFRERFGDVFGEDEA